MYRSQAREEWDQARRKALWATLQAHFRGKRLSLLNFNEVSQCYQLTQASYRGVQTIPLEKIVGSVGRYQDFIQTFLPVTTALEERWQNIASLCLDPSKGGVPPIEVYQVGDLFFVKDGNHRVSVASQLGRVDIEAHVWEYPEEVVGLTPDTDIDTALLEAEQHVFLAQTRLDELRPGHSIRLTAPGGYDIMLGQIIYYQYALSQIDGEEISYEEAVTAWYDMLYETTIQLIEEADIPVLFSDRTVADFFIWVIKYHRELEERYGQPVLIKDAASEIERQHPPNLLRRSWRACRRWLKQRLRLCKLS
jgi:hypothetical protein